MMKKINYFLCLMLGVALGIVVHGVFYNDRVDNVKNIRKQLNDSKYIIELYENYFVANEVLTSKVYNENYEYFVSLIETDEFDKYIDAYQSLYFEQFERFAELEQRIDSVGNNYKVSYTFTND